MSKYTQTIQNAIQSGKQSVANALMTDEQRAQQKLRSFRSKSVYGTNQINEAGVEMAEIAARFITNAVRFIEDPGFDCVQFQIDWSDPQGLFAPESEMNSALRYLSDTGETERYNELQKVIEIMHQLFDATTDEAGRQYYLQNIAGIDNLNNTKRQVGIVNDVQLHCIDDIKWTIRAVNVMLEDIFYDQRKQIEVLPRNLRRFSCYMTVMDVRDMNNWWNDRGTFVNEYTATDSDTGATETRQRYRRTDENLMFYEQIKNAAGGNAGIQKQSLIIICPSVYFNTFNNTLPAEVSNTEFDNPLAGQFNLQVWSWYTQSIFPALDMIVSAIKTSDTKTDAASNMSFKQLVGQAVKGYATKLLSSAVTTLKNTAIAYGTSFAAQKMMEWGVTDAINGILKYTKPELLMQQYGHSLLDDLLGMDTDAELRSAYVPDLGKAQSSGNNPDASAKPQYVRDLGQASSTGNTADASAKPQYVKDLGDATSQGNLPDGSAGSQYQNDLGTVNE